VNPLAHPITQRRVHQSMAFDPGFALERGADDHGVEMPSVAADLQPFAVQPRADRALQLLRGR